MTNSTASNITHTDLLIVGGGPGGISSSSFFARLNRPHIMYDSGLYRNAQSPSAHTIINFEGESPKVWRDSAIAELQAKYGTNLAADGSKTGLGIFQYRQGLVTKLSQVHDAFDNHEGFEAIDDTGNIVRARKVILATGIKDVLPPIPGLQEAWGARAIHCIFCHGTETANMSFAFLFNPGNPYNAGVAGAVFKFWHGLNHGPERYILTHGADVDTEEGLKATGLGAIISLLRAKK